VATIRNVSQCEFYEESLITKGIVAERVTVSMATQTDNVADVLTKGDAALQPENQPAPVNPNQATDIVQTAAQARPRRDGHDKNYVAFTILAGADSFEHLMQTDPVKALKSLAVHDAPMVLVSGTAEAGKNHIKGDIIRLHGPQGEYTRVCPKNTVEAEKTPEAATWRALETNHIAELERNVTVTEVHISEAEGKMIHPTKLDYRIKQLPDTSFGLE